MKNVSTLIFLLAFSIFVQASGITEADYKNADCASINSAVLGYTLSIYACEHNAGAISAMFWKNQNFVDNYDKGRQLQSALFFGQSGIAHNPTEAGISREYDGHNIVDGKLAPQNPSSSKLLSYKLTSNTLETETEMANWIPRAGVNKTGCTEVFQQNETPPSPNWRNECIVLSGVIFKKKVTIGWLGIENVIEYNVSYEIPAGFGYEESATFEILTGYMPPVFNKFATFDIDRDEVKEIDGHNTTGENPLPLILATQDLAHSIGIINPQLPEIVEGNKKRGYNYQQYDGHVSKFSTVLRRGLVNEKKIYSFKSYLVIGDVNTVINTMRQVNSKLSKM
jgi:hypothetical protein